MSMKKEIIQYNNMIVFVEDKDALPPVPPECPICNQLIDSIDSISSFRMYQCCAWCKLKWVDRNKEGWMKGESRPTQAEISNALYDVVT